MSDLPRGGAPRNFGRGRYEVLGVLGSGGTATVYRVRDTGLDVERALKVLRVGNADLGRRLAAEARMMVQLDNPHILRVVDVGEEEGRPYLVMEYLRGGTLADVGELGPLPFQSALAWTVQVLAALSAAHLLGIVHRDVKPSNVLLDERGVARLADFGIAFRENSDEERATRTGVAMGTLAFMAPEQRLDARSVSRSADLYAVGAMLYSLVTYRSAMDLFVVQPGDKRLHGLPEPLIDVLLKATRYEPRERYDSASEMAADLLVLLDDAADEPLVAMEDGEGPPQRRLTATPGPLASRIRPPKAVTDRAIDTLVGPDASIQRIARPTISPPPTVVEEGAKENESGGLRLLAFASAMGLVLVVAAGIGLWQYPLRDEQAVQGDVQPAPTTEVATPAVQPDPPARPVETVAEVQPTQPEPVVPQPEPQPQAVVTAPAPRVQPVPPPEPAVQGPFPAGRYVGMLDGRPIDLRITETNGELTAVVTAWFSQADRAAGTDNRQSRAMAATWDDGDQTLRLVDVADIPGAGSIEATWNGRRFAGRFRNHAGTHITAFEARPNEG